MIFVEHNYRLTFLGNREFPTKSLLMRHFFPPMPPIRPCALERVASAILSVLLVIRSWLFSNRSAVFKVDNERRLSVVVGWWLVMGVVDLVSVLAMVVAVAGGDVRSRAVGFWSRPLHTCRKDIYTLFTS